MATDLQRVVAALLRKNRHEQSGHISLEIWSDGDVWLSRGHDRELQKCQTFGAMVQELERRYPLSPTPTPSEALAELTLRASASRYASRLNTYTSAALEKIIVAAMPKEAHNARPTRPRHRRGHRVRGGAVDPRTTA